MEGLNLLPTLKIHLIVFERPFETIAKKHSQDPGSRNNGGSLGWSKRGSFVKAFEEAAFTSEINQLVGPIETDFGFHLIETLEKKGDKIRVRHILTTPKLTKDDTERAFNFATSLQADSIKTLEDLPVPITRIYFILGFERK